MIEIDGCLCIRCGGTLFGPISRALPFADEFKPFGLYFRTCRPLYLWAIDPGGEYSRGEQPCGQCAKNGISFASYSGRAGTIEQKAFDHVLLLLLIL